MIFEDHIATSLNLKIEDIDSKRMLVKVNLGKGNKDRYTLLSKTVLEDLRIYYKTYKPKEWLFEGQFKDKVHGGVSKDDSARFSLPGNWNFKPRRRS